MNYTIEDYIEFLSGAKFVEGGSFSGTYITKFEGQLTQIENLAGNEAKGGFTITFSSTPTLNDDDVFVITANTQRIHFEQFLYEWILLAVPMKKVHPDLRDEGDDDDESLWRQLPWPEMCRLFESFHLK